LGEAGLKLLALAREKTGLKVVTEVMDTDDLPLVADYADVLNWARATCRTSPCYAAWAR